MDTLTNLDIAVFEAGKALQQSRRGAGLQIQDLEIATRFSWGTICNSINKLELLGKVTSERTGTGRRKHGTIRFRGRIVRKSA